MSTDLTVISPLSWVQEAFKDYFDKAHMTDSSHSCITSAVARAEKTVPTPSTASAPEPSVKHPIDYWTAAYDYGFEPARAIRDSDAVWITADLLIANNAWRARHNLSPLLLEAPAPYWLAALPRTFTRRTVITVPVSRIRTWTALPDGLRERPWSQLSSGRVPEFRAARRNLRQLQNDLNQAPDDSLITINTHLDGISEEWCVIVKHGKAVASSGYCVHRSQDENSHDILTVFDGARFHDSYRGIAESLATRAARTSHLDDASIIVGFLEADGDGETGRGITQDSSDIVSSNTDSPNTSLPNISSLKTALPNTASSDTGSPNTTSSDTGSLNTTSPDTGSPKPLPSPSNPQPVIIEADPVWCTTPYPYETVEEANAFLRTISDSRLYGNGDGTFRKENGQTVAQAEIYVPDPWMVRHAAHRYDRF